jgi:hypothetical protein
MQSLHPLEAVISWANPNPQFWQMPSRIYALIDHFLAFDHLCDRLEDLPRQFVNPQPRPWAAIAWHSVDATQVAGLPLSVFLSAIAGAVTVETPIRGYASVSWQYLVQLHPPMSKFVGGVFDEHQNLIEPGMWEKEERQHSPALSKIYAQLSGKKLMVTPKSVKGYQSSENPREDLFCHGLHRVMTEYGATSLYLWLMAHSTGALQQVLGEILRDEINHMTKFLGFGLWAYPDSYGERIRRTLLNCLRSHLLSNQSAAAALQHTSHIRSTIELTRTFRRVMDLVDWSTWNYLHRLELIYTFSRVLQQMLSWSNTLTRDYLEQIFGVTPASSI